VRMSVLESPLFAREVEAETVERQPIIEVVKRNPREIILSALLRMSEQAPFYIFTAFVLAYGTETLGFSKGFMTNSVMLAAALSLFSVPFFGHLSDRIGRRRMYLFGAGATLLWGVPYFLLLDSKVGVLVVVAIVVSLIPHDMQYGPQAALIAETFPTRLRYSGAGIGYQLASVIAGGPAPLIAAAILAATGSSTGISIYILICCALSAIALALMPRRSLAEQPPVTADRSG
jgi:MFS family permease